MREPICMPELTHELNIAAIEKPKVAAYLN